MKLEQLIELAQRSTCRMVEALKRKNDPLFRPFMVRESSILLKRAWSIWWRIRLRRYK